MNPLTWFRKPPLPASLRFDGNAFPPSYSTISMHRLQHRLLIILCGILALKGILFLFQAWRTVLYPFEWSTMDGYYIYHGLRLLSGKPLYFGYQSLLMPFEYVPVYPAIIGALAKIFGPGVWFERAFSTACAFGIGAIIVRVVHRHSSTAWAAAAAGLLFFAPVSLSIWYLVRGIDILAALLALGAVAAAAETRIGARRAVVLVFLFTVAFFTKQTAVFPAGAVIAYFLSERRWKDAVVVGGGFSAASVGAFLFIQRMSGGWFFDNAFLMTSQNPYYPRLLIDLFSQFALALFISLPVAFVHALRKLRAPEKAWSFYFFFTLASACLAAKAGAALSYFVPLFSAVCIMSGLWLGDANLRQSKPKLFTAVLILFLLQAAGFLADKNPVPSVEDYRHAATLDTWIRQHPGPILTERIDSFAVRNGRDLNVEAVQLPVLIMHRKYDPNLVIEPVREKRFSLIIYSGIYFGGIPAIKKAIFKNYRVVDEVNVGLFVGGMKFLIMVPGTAEAA